MEQPQAYSIAELTRCKLLHEASIKNRDLRRLVGHVNMYDRLLDIMNAEEMREREKSPPRSIKTVSDAGHVKFSERPSPNRSTEQTLEIADKDMETSAYASHCEDVSMGYREGYGVIEVAEVEILDDDDDDDD
jgi:hypothetical protein